MSYPSMKRHSANNSVYVAENIYVWILPSTKISILFFYLRVFPHEPMRFAFWAVIGITTLATVTISVLTIFQCHPVSYFWDKDIHSGRCLNLNALAYANAGMSIIEDVFIVALPIPIIARLKMSRSKKFGIALMYVEPLIVLSPTSSRPSYPCPSPYTHLIKHLLIAHHSTGLLSEVCSCP